MEFFTIDEFAKKIKMCPQTVRRAIKSGKIYAIRPSVGIKSPYRIPESELERLQVQALCERKT